MKSRVVLMALLCLLLIFTGAMAADKDPVAYENLVYNGSPQVLVNTEGTSREGYTKVYCKLSGETAYSQCADVKGTDAQTYNVDYMWSNMPEPPESTTYSPTNTISVTINQSKLTVEWDKSEFTYDAEYHPSVTVKDSNGNVIPQGSDPDVNFKLHNRKKDANTETEPKYTATFEIVNNNYILADGQESNHEFTITPAKVTVTTDPEVVAGPLTFNDFKQELIKTLGVAEGGKITYVLDDEYISETSVKARIPGTHSVKYFITPEPNYTTDITENNPKLVGSVVINRLPVTVTIEGNSEEKPYSGNEESVTGYTVKNISEELYKENLVELAEGKEAKAAGTDVSGSPYTMGLVPNSFINKNETCFDVTFQVTDGKLTITKKAIEDEDITDPILVTGPLTYNGGKQPLIDTAGSVKGGEMVYILDLENSNYEYKNAGDVKAGIPMTHTVHYYIVPDDNHTTEITKDNPKPVGNVVIDRLPVNVKVTGKSEKKTYNGEEQSISGFEVTEISNPLYPETNVVLAEGKEAKATGKNVQDTPYNMGLDQDFFATLQDTLFNVTFEVTDGSLTIEPLDVDVAITGKTEEKVYNGKKQSVEGYTFKADSDLFTADDFTLVEGAKAKASGTDVREQPYMMNLTNEKFIGDNPNFNPTFTVTDGSLTITPLTGITVAIKGKKTSIPYNGMLHNLYDYKTPVITLNGEPTELYQNTEDYFTRDNTCGKAATKKTDAGTYPMELTKACFTNINKNFADVDFDVTDGELTITPLSGVVVTIKGHTGTANFDGKEHNISKYDVTGIKLNGEDTTLYTADYFTKDDTCGQSATGKTEVGTYPMELTKACFTNINKNFADVDFDVTDGKLTIIPQAVTITAGSTKKYVYDGTALTNSEFTVEPEVDHEFTVTMTKDSTVTDASKDGVPNVIATVDGVAVTTGEPKVIGNFTVTTVDGTLQVSRRPVTITAANAEQVYNGSALTSNEATWTELPETDEHEFVVTMTEGSTITNIGTQSNVIATVDGKNVSESGETIVGNYLVTIANGTLEVTPKEVTITAADGKWEFDNHTHKQPEFTTTDLEEGDNHKFEVVMTPKSTVTRATTKPNIIDTVDGIAVTTGEPTKVGNYIVTTVDGTLTVTQKGGIVVTVEGKKSTVTYDGKEHKLYNIKDNVVITLDGKPTELYTTGDFERDLTCGVAVGTNAGTYPMGLSEACFTNKNANFSSVTFNVTDGELVIDPAEVTLAWNSDKSFVYSGKPQGPTDKSITIDGLADGDEQAKVAAITVTGSPMTDAGDYVARAEVTFDPANYVLSKDAETEFPYAIKKATITVNPAPALKTGPLPYTGNYQALLETLGGLTCNNNADSCPGSIIYVINGQWKTNPDENPSADAVGEYTVSYYVTNYDTANYDCAADETHPVEIGKITIRPANATITIPDGQSFTYTGENLRPDITVNYENGTSVTYPYTENPNQIKITITASGTETYPNIGTYTITAGSNDPNLSIDPVTATFTITKAAYVDKTKTGDVTEANSFAVKPIEGLTYNGNFQELVTVEWNQTTIGTPMFAVVDENGVVIKTTASLNISDFLPAAVGKNAGIYSVYYYIEPDSNHTRYPADPDTYVVDPVLVIIAPANLADALITLEPSVLNYTGDVITVNPLVTFNNIPLEEGVDYVISGNEGVEEGTYTLVITAVEGSNFVGTNSLIWQIKDLVPNRIDMFRVGKPEEVCLRCGVLGGELPATGLPTRVDVPLAVRPEGLNYTNLNMRIQIPTIDVDVELEGVPTMDGAWKVEWLADNAGLLSGTALPGDGYSIVAAHNTLNAEEYGPFALLSTLENNDTIFVNAPDGTMKLFRVYANELMAPNDMEKLASVAEQEMNTLVLVTCENESVDGGYLNRRVVFAKPLN